MTERTPAETVEAVAEFLDADKGLIPAGLTSAEAYAWAVFKVRTVALGLRLNQPAKRGRRPNPKAE